MRIRHLSLILLTAATACAAFGAGGKPALTVQTENYPSGKLKTQYTVNDAGKKEGVCREFFEDGLLKSQMTYKSGVLNGEARTYFPAKPGEPAPPNLKPDQPATAKRLHTLTTYVDGKRRGNFCEFDPNGRQIKEEVYIADRLVYPRSEKLIRAELAAIDSAPVRCQASPRSGQTKPTFVTATPAQVNAFRALAKARFLCGVPHQGMVLDDQCNKDAQLAAEINQALGEMTHTPKNPGWPEAKYEAARDACGKSNLFVFTGKQFSLELAVNSWMDDSDDRNIDRVGHRRWAINPPMLKVGFGKATNFAAMYAFDTGRKDVPDWDYVAYPPRGLVPTSFIPARTAWSVSPNPAKYDKPDADEVKATITPVRVNVESGLIETTGQKLPLDTMLVENGGYGSGPCVIFRPRRLRPAARDACEVVITGLKCGGKDASIRYIVEFFGQ